MLQTIIFLVRFLVFIELKQLINMSKYREHQNNLTLNQKVIAFEEQLMIFKMD